MEDPLTLDLEFKRYLEILRPHVAQLRSPRAARVCEAWVGRLARCGPAERPARNKHVFSLCHQLARGVLREPFTDPPPPGALADTLDSDDASEIECAIVDPDDTNTETIYDGKVLSPTETISRENHCTKSESLSDCDMKSFTRSRSSRKRTVVCYTCPDIVSDYRNFIGDGNYGSRAQHLIKKLRDIKNENCKLHSKLLSLKEESQMKKVSSDEESDIVKVDNATRACIPRKESSTTLKSLKIRLDEVQESRKELIEQISTLQEQLDNYNVLKSHEIEEIEAKYKMEIIKEKSTVKQEVKDVYEKKIDSLKTNYEAKIQEIEENTSSKLRELKLTKDNVIEDLNKSISAKTLEIERLKSGIDELKSHLHSVLEKYIDKHGENYGEEAGKFKVKQLEKRLNLLEKSKMKSSRVYEAKIEQLQKEKHMAECLFQLQIVKQRTQLVSEVTDENQAELAAALDKLEGKYKAIVANVQATAIQRRLHDQRAIESILHAACTLPENTQPTQYPKTRHNQIYDNEVAPLLYCNKGNKSSEEDAIGGFCLNGGRAGELFERMYIPQRDNTDTLN